ncbi:sensor histidine kinase [Deinococcus ruber]|uniref:histidine kinase n=1 Tax=Deinococcus ruber TaxID=1848197 RepID=A0A918C5G9_9DEIO|nr:ATP-binding protein [Deinococcus ruber]GGR07785.1 sensor histidine kinase [Deinococcus ruber]
MARPAQPPVSLIRFLLQPLLLPLLLLLLVGVAVTVGVNRNVVSVRQSNASQARIDAIHLIAVDVLNLETGLRGYLLTARPEYLEPYHLGQQQLSRRIQSLQLHAVNDRQRDDLQHISLLMQQWFSNVAEPQIHIRPESLATTVVLVKNGSGKQLIDEVRRVLGVLEKNETVRLNTSLNASARTLQQARLLTIFGLLAALFFLVVSAVQVARTFASGMASLNAAAGRVAEGQYDLPLPDVQVAEVHQLTQELRRMAASVQSRASHLEQLNEDLARSNRELEQFAYVASHDLQEPLRTIGSFTGLLARRYQGQLDARADQYIAYTLSATERLKQLIQDLLAYSRTRHSTQPTQVVDVQLLVNDVLQDFQEFIQRSGAQVSAHALPVLRGRPELLRHVFMNLIGNALKFADPARPPRVEVRAEPLPGFWRLHVQDNGVGIEAAYHDRIFDIFQRLHGVSETEGNGIGLAIVKSVIERHGGEITLTSIPGVGTTFSFTIPILQEPADATD